MNDDIGTVLETLVDDELACIHCREPITDTDPVYHYANGPMAHRNCMLRGVVGSVAHQEQRCSCYIPGSTCGDPPELTRRQAADAAVVAWLRLNAPICEDEDCSR